MLLKDKLGICQWFHFQDYAALDITVAILKDLDVTHFRTGISWADYYRDGGKDWYDHQMKALREAGLEVLLSIWHTPPSISEGNACASPPRRLQDYADFIDLVITDYGDCFSSLELWNEPNNRLKWDFQHYDPRWEKFGEMIVKAAYWARHRDVRTVLGGMIPVDVEWLKLMQEYGVLEQMDVIAIHGFPGMWWEEMPNWDWHTHWHGWEQKIEQLKPLAERLPVWITETGLATWDLAVQRRSKEDLQVQMLIQAAEAPADRVYWYSTIDLDPDRDAIEGFHVDENEYHLGLVRFDGTPKPAYDVFHDLMQVEVDPVKNRIHNGT